MNAVQLYKNPKHYPQYTHSITAYGPVVYATPRNMDLKSGYVDLAVDFTDVDSCNYLSFVRDNRTIYAWVTNVEERGGNLRFRFHYEVDPLRTYLSRLNLDNQFVVRSTVPTEIFDPFLGSTEAVNDIEQTEYDIGTSTKRVLMVQVKRYESEGYSNVPVQPSVNNFYAYPYTMRNWTNDLPIVALLSALTAGRPDNIVTMYSVPYFDTSGLVTVSLPVRRGSTTTSVANWKFIDSTTAVHNLTTNETPLVIPPELTKKKHSVSLVIPEAGIISIPDELLYKTGLALRQDVDIYSGASNYMLVTTGGKPYHLSARGSSVSSIPIVGDPQETYLSQNQNALAVSVLGDVATVAVGVASFGTGVGGAIGGGVIASGLSSLANTYANVQDASRVQTNPPAYLGTALAPNFNQKFWVVIISTNVTNASLVNSEFGYPCNILKPLVVPTLGFIQTKMCSVKSDGSVPLWAIKQINALFDEGIKVE